MRKPPLANTIKNGRHRPKSLKRTSSLAKEFISQLKRDNNSAVINNTLINCKKQYTPEPVQNIECFNEFKTTDKSMKNKVIKIENGEVAEDNIEQEEDDQKNQMDFWRFSPVKIEDEKSNWDQLVLANDELMCSLEDRSMEILPHRDDDDVLHGKPISYAVAKVCFLFPTT